MKKTHGVCDCHSFVMAPLRDKSRTFHRKMNIWLFLHLISMVSTRVSPGGRYAHVMEQTDSNTLLIFGGWGNTKSDTAGFLNDVWKFDISSSTFSHVKGPQAINGLATYGSIPDPANQPGAREFVASTLVNSKMYVFGGLGYVSYGSYGHLANMWSFEFDPSTLSWVYLGGSQVLNSVGIYGVANSYNTSFRPGGRYSAGMSRNKDVTELILFGGNGRASNTTATGYLGDVWSFRLSDNAWAYKAGHATINQFGTTSVIPTDHKPGTRQGMVFECAPETDICYIFGGYGQNNGEKGLVI